MASDRSGGPSPAGPAAGADQQAVGVPAGGDVPDGDVADGGVATWDADRQAAVERWFLRRGTPHLIAAYSGRTDVLTRLVPVLVFIALAESAGALDARWSAWVNAGAFVAALALLVGSWVVANRLRGRPAFARPDRVDAPGLVVFVVAPALLPVLFSAQYRHGAIIAGLNVVLLGLLYGIASFGLVPMTRWALGHTADQVRTVGGLVGRALPLLLLITVLLLFSAETWEVAAGLPGPLLGAVFGLFVLVGGGFLATRIPREIARLAAFHDPAEVVAGCQDSPLVDLAVDHAGAAVGERPLRRVQRVNLSLVALFSQGVQVALVVLGVGTFFVVFGVLTVSSEVLENWTTQPAEAWVTWTVAGRDLVLGPALVKVSVVLAGFAGLYFAVYLVTDATYRSEFLESLLGEMRETLAVRAVYLVLVDHHGDLTGGVGVADELSLVSGHGVRRPG